MQTTLLTLLYMVLSLLAYAAAECDYEKETEVLLQMEEVLLYTDDLAATYEEVASSGGRVLLQLGNNLVVARTPNSSALVSASHSIPHEASAETAQFARAYWGHRRDLLKPKGEVRPWSDLAPPIVVDDDSKHTRFESADSPYTATMRGKIAAQILTVSGPGSLAFTLNQKNRVLIEVIAGLDWWATTAPSSAGLSFVIYWSDVSIATANNPSCGGQCSTSNDYDNCHYAFINPALTALGYATGKTGLDDLAQDTKDAAGATGAYLAFFTHYTVCYSAYALGLGAGQIIMEYELGSSYTPEEIDKVFAHQTGHVFNAPDEYDGCNCNTNYGRGSCTDKNSNCHDIVQPIGNHCTSNSTSCIMNRSDFVVCSHTRKHIGWC